MSFHICIKTDMSLQQLANEVRNALSLSPFSLDTMAESPYCQFDMMGMLILLRWADEDERDPEVANYPYCFDLHFSFTDHELDTDAMEYQLQPYYAQLLAFRLNVETACNEKKRVGPHWQVRYCYYRKNPNWDGSILFGEEGWQPAVLSLSPSNWRTMRPHM